jgi:hypothetical protein
MTVIVVSTGSGLGSGVGAASVAVAVGASVAAASVAVGAAAVGAEVASVEAALVGVGVGVLDFEQAGKSTAKAISSASTAVSDLCFIGVSSFNGRIGIKNTATAFAITVIKIDLNAASQSPAQLPGSACINASR